MSKAAMRFVGEHAGMRWYWADELFDQPGLVRWDGTKHVHLDDLLATAQAVKVAAGGAPPLSPEGIDEMRAALTALVDAYVHRNGIDDGLDYIGSRAASGMRCRANKGDPVWAMWDRAIAALATPARRVAKIDGANAPSAPEEHNATSDGDREAIVDVLRRRNYSPACADDIAGAILSVLRARGRLVDCADPEWKAGYLAHRREMEAVDQAMRDCTPMHEGATMGEDAHYVQVGRSIDGHWPDVTDPKWVGGAIWSKIDPRDVLTLYGERDAAIARAERAEKANRESFPEVYAAYEMVCATLVVQQVERDRMRECLGFFASVIKSGEPWTDTCERQYRMAIPAPGGSSGEAGK